MGTPPLVPERRSEVSFIGTSLQHLELAGRPMFYGLAPIPGGDAKAVLIRDGHFELKLTDRAVVRAWRLAFETAERQLDEDQRWTARNKPEVK